MNPPSNLPQEKFHVPRDTGTWRCLACDPPVTGKGGQRELYSHYDTHHLNLTASQEAT